MASGTDVQLGLLFSNKEVLFRDVKIQGSLGCSDHETVGITIQREEIGRRAAEYRLGLQESRPWVIQRTAIWDPTGDSSEGRERSRNLAGL